MIANSRHRIEYARPPVRYTTPAARARAQPVSYTHLDVYKRQQKDLELVHESIAEIKEVNLTTRLTVCLLYTSRCV